MELSLWKQFNIGCLRKNNSQDLIWFTKDKSRILSIPVCIFAD